MSSLATLKSRIGSISKRLTRLNADEPLGKLSLALIIFLDIFVLTNLFIGLGAQTRQLTSPDDTIPTTCRNMVINHDWVEETRIPELSAIVLSKQRSTWPEKNDTRVLHTICGELQANLDKLKSQPLLINDLDQRDELVKRYSTYDNYQKFTDLEAQNILSAMKVLDAQINELPEVKAFWSLMDQQKSMSSTLTNDLRHLNFIYPLKRLGIRVLFLAPVLILLVFWNNASIRKNHGLHTLISSHLIIVCLIPVFFELCNTVYDIIPHILLQKLFELLVLWNLIALWYYVLILRQVTGLVTEALPILRRQPDMPLPSLPA